MTVEELSKVLDKRMADQEISRIERHNEILKRLDKINGRVSDHDKDISNLKVRDAYVTGIGIGGGTILQWFLGKLGLGG